MVQVFIEYYYWEDYINGMYREVKKEDEEFFIKSDVILLKDPKEFFNSCKDVLSTYIVSCLVNLTNTSCNRKAWLGQAACNLRHNSSERCTRKAWKLLTKKEQLTANLIAEKIIKSYETKNKKLHCNMGSEMLF
jgi:hypothetical protein